MKPDTLHKLAQLADDKYGRKNLGKLLDRLGKLGMEVTIQEKDIDLDAIPVEQIIEMEKALVELIEFKHY
jgi:hypothetical protein